MVVVAAPIALHSTRPLGLAILVAVVLLGALAAAGYFIGRMYVNGRFDIRNWK
jgi:uncharacterized integral membrane protein